MPQPNFIAVVNDGQEIAVDNTKLDIIRIDEHTFHIIGSDHKSYHATLIEADFDQKVFHFKINGNSYQVALQDQFDQLVKKLGLSVQVNQQVKDIKAPMPGLVLEILVEPQQEVKKGEPLLILEAMKMENVIKSPADSVVKTIDVSKGVAVEKGQPLIKME